MKDRGLDMKDRGLDMKDRGLTRQSVVSPASLCAVRPNQ